MTHKIFRSTFITCIIVLAACFLLTFSVLYSFFEHQTENELKGEIDYIAYSIKDGCNFVKTSHIRKIKKNSVKNIPTPFKFLFLVRESPSLI